MISRSCFSLAIAFSCTFAVAEDLEFKALRAAADRVSESVVQIETVGTANSAGEISIGAPISGTVVDDEGHIITSLWGLQKTPASILVVLPDGKRLPAQLVARDYSREIVLLKVKSPEGLKPISIQRSGELTIGQWAVAVGRGITPKSASISIGIVSAQARMYGRAVQIDARVSPPFYGGPVVDIRGEVIGISVPLKPSNGPASDKTGWYDSGIAFVIPGNAIASRLEKLRGGEDIRAGLAGIVPAGKMPFLRDVKVSAVRALSPAKRAGMKVDDQIIGIDGKPVRYLVDVKQLLGNRDAGESITVRIKRGEEELDLGIDLVGEIDPFAPKVLGVLPKMEDDKIVVSHVFKDSPAEKAGILKGDVIQKLGQQEIADVDQLRLRIGTQPKGEKIALTVQRGDESKDIDCDLADVSEDVPEDVPQLENPIEANKFEVEERSLADSPNKAVLLKPEGDLELGLLVLLARPGAESLEKLVDPWRGVAAKHGLAVLAIAASEEKRWKPAESDVVLRMIQQVENSLQINKQQVVTTGYGAGAEMALMLAFRERETVRGAAVSSGLRVGGFSLQENDPSFPTQILVAGGKNVPMWGRVISARGFPILRAASESKKPIEEDESVRKEIARWVKSMERI